MVHSQNASKEPLAKLWNVDNDDIRKYLNIEKNLSNVDEIIKPFLDNDNFAGTSIDAIQNMVFVYTLNFSRAEQIKNLTEIRPYVNFLNFSQVINSTTKLNSIFEKISSSVQNYKTMGFTGYISVKVNNIVIASCDEYKNQSGNSAFINATKMYYPIFTYYYCEQPPPSTSNTMLENRDLDKIMLAGDGISIYSKIRRLKTRCSAGFWARDRDQPSINYIATAGHCQVGPDDIYYLLPWDSDKTTDLGTMSKNFLELIDFQLIYINNSNVKPKPMVRNTDAGPGQYSELKIHDDIAVSSIGVHLCSSGFVTHVKCGYVEALNGFNAFGEFLHVNVFIVSVLTIVGDSGGPMFSYHEDLSRVSLNGILSSGFSDKFIGGISSVSTLSSIFDIVKNISLVKAD
ncbi:protease [Gigaspora margarita]|uniref:Protease n=1 Tax=Gigaspora margarita TaxID=4874 RepID=A0A8H4EPG5_GIGMA|nr:protease [Gigaspora margarita]